MPCALYLPRKGITGPNNITASIYGNPKSTRILQKQEEKRMNERYTGIATTSMPAYRFSANYPKGDNRLCHRILSTCLSNTTRYSFQLLYSGITTPSVVVYRGPQTPDELDRRFAHVALMSWCNGVLLRTDCSIYIQYNSSNSTTVVYEKQLVS